MFLFLFFLSLMIYLFFITNTVCPDMFPLTVLPDLGLFCVMELLVLWVINLVAFKLYPSGHLVPK